MIVMMADCSDVRRISVGAEDDDFSDYGRGRRRRRLPRGANRSEGQGDAPTVDGRDQRRGGGFPGRRPDEVLVWDGHDGSQTLSTLTIHPKAKLLMGALGASMMMERRFSAVAYVGQHSKANIRGGIMAHSYSSLGIQNMLLNGKPVGEIDVIAAMAGHFGTPVIMLSGDQAAANELREIVPDAEFAVVKEGLGRYACISLSAAAARDTIREAARRSVSKIGSIRPYTIKGPVALQIEYTTRNSLPIDAELRRGAEVIDDRTIRFTG